MQNISSKYIYWLTLIVLSLFLIATYYKYKMVNDEMNSHQNVKVLISKVVCNKANYRNNYIVANYNRKKYIVNVGRTACESYIVANSVTLFYSKNYDQFFEDGIETSNEKWTMIFIAGVIFVILYLLFFKKNK